MFSNKCFYLAAEFKNDDKQTVDEYIEAKGLKKYNSDFIVASLTSLVREYALLAIKEDRKSLLDKVYVSQGTTEEEYMFNGLMSVIDVLDEIHQNTDTELTISTKRKFEKV